MIGLKHVRQCCVPDPVETAEEYEEIMLENLADEDLPKELDD